MDNAHALVIGIANYQHVNKLPPTVLKDAQDIHTLLIDPQICGYPSSNVELLLDQQATKTAILQALAELAQRSNTTSTAFFYISSHGGRLEAGPQAGEYLIPVDAEPTSLQSLAQTAIEGDDFTQALRAIPARKLVVIFDCCHSAGIGQPKDVNTPALKSGLSVNLYEALGAGRGRVILASSRDTESSYVLPGATNSLFTQHLLAGLRGAVPSDDGFIRIFNLFEYLQPKVVKDQPHQHPVFKGDLEENFPVALRIGGQKAIAPSIEGDFFYDAYISYVDKGRDSDYVWDTLVPRLETSGLKVAVSGDAEKPGVGRVMDIERGIKQAKRTVIVLSEAYLADHMATFQNMLSQTMGIQEGAWRLLPVQIDQIDNNRLPTRISMLTTLNLSNPRRADREFERLIEALRAPLPRM